MLYRRGVELDRTICWTSICQITYLILMFHILCLLVTVNFDNLTAPCKGTHDTFLVPQIF